MFFEGTLRGPGKEQGHTILAHLTREADIDFSSNYYGQKNLNYIDTYIHTYIFKLCETCPSFLQMWSLAEN